MVKMVLINIRILKYTVATGIAIISTVLANKIMKGLGNIMDIGRKVKSAEREL